MRPKNRIFFLAVSAVLASASGCGAPRAVPAPAPAPAPAVHQAFGYAMAWTRTAGVALRGDSGSVAIPYASMRLDAYDSDSASIAVRCWACPGSPVGRVDKSDVVYQPKSPAEAASGDLAEFVLAVREAARRHDVDALRPVLSPRFVHATDGPDGVLEALAFWQSEGFRSLDAVVAVLDRGVVEVQGMGVQAAPPAYALRPGYGALRAGFQRTGGRWQWVFLVHNGP
ncbi:MAG TPA: hypothetical protein VFE05_16565 [Longimicrobiaceae bacterium]|jgi:hypothetical protein|nr:hypothetical protein [Longimicrobiaceae bacterium]